VRSPGRRKVLASRSLILAEVDFHHLTARSGFYSYRGTPYSQGSTR
jgi:hypothetical protein